DHRRQLSKARSVDSTHARFAGRGPGERCLRFCVRFRPTLRAIVWYDKRGRSPVSLCNTSMTCCALCCMLNSLHGEFVAGRLGEPGPESVGLVKPTLVFRDPISVRRSGRRQRFLRRAILMVARPVAFQERALERTDSPDTSEALLEGAMSPLQGALL